MNKAAEETKKVRGPSKPMPFVLRDHSTGKERLICATCETDVRAFAHAVTRASTDDIMRLAKEGIELEQAGG